MGNWLARRKYLEKVYSAHPFRPFFGTQSGTLDGAEGRPLFKAEKLRITRGRTHACTNTGTDRSKEKIYAHRRAYTFSLVDSLFYSKSNEDLIFDAWKWFTLHFVCIHCVVSLEFNYLEIFETKSIYKYRLIGKFYSCRYDFTREKFLSFKLCRFCIHRIFK